MGKGILGKKLGMTQVFDEKGRQVPVTVVVAGPCAVVQRRTPERDGYAAVQLAFGEVKTSRLNKPELGHFKRAGVAPRKLLREIRWEGADVPEVGQEVTVGIFAAGELVDVVGRSKGKGFAGMIKRHHAGRGAMTHGSKYHRRVGSLNAGTSPSRVFKGRKLPGHLGDARVTVQRLELVRVDAERNLLLVKGAVPGVRGAWVTVQAAHRPGKTAAK
ncbi:MAG TPA: 50S ribosomal protein L3 [Bacillota bacterium]|nr:50S ribosomal protein L3 [Bacillota bacterium]